MVSVLRFPRYCLTTDQLVYRHAAQKLKQILQMKHDMVKNPSWWEANQFISAAEGFITQDCSETNP